MSMKRKVTIGMIALLTNMILYTGCSNSNVSLSNSSPTLPEVNETSIAAAIDLQMLNLNHNLVFMPHII